MPPSPELKRRVVVVDGRPGHYLVAAPAGRTAGIVLSLHGRGTTARWQAWYTGMDRLARDEGAAVVFPQGSVQVDRRGYAWDHERDLPYLAAVVEAARDEFGGPAGGVCVCGISAGARMASFFAAARAADVAALGAVAGLRAPQVAPARPVPVIAFHGLADRALPYLGGPGARWKQRAVRRQNRRAGLAPGWSGGAGGWTQSVPDAARAWAVANGVEADPAERRIGRRLTKVTYGEGGAAEVTLWTFADAGHTWPGRPAGLVSRLLFGRTSADLDATEEIWRFFRRAA